MKKRGQWYLILFCFLYIAGFSRITERPVFAETNTASEGANAASGGGVDVSAVSAVLIEGSTGEILYE